MRRPRTLVLLVALTTLGAGVACGGGGGDDKSAKGTEGTRASGARDDDDADERGGSTITVSVKEFAFDPKELTLQAGKATTIALKNEGAVEHDFTIDNPAFKLKALATKTETGQLTIPTAGSYTFYCSVPGHRQAGMEGKATVS